MSISEPIYRKTFAYAEKAYESALVAQSAKQLALYNVLCRNATGSAIAMGIFTRMNNPETKIYNYVAVGTVLTDITAAIQAETATEILAADGDAIVIGNIDQSGLIGFNGTIAETGTAATYTLKYYNGTAMVTLPNFEVITAFAANRNYIVFAAPIDWVKGGVSGANTDKYYVEFKATAAAGTTAPTIDEIWLGKMHAYRSNIAAHGTIDIEVVDHTKPLTLSSEEGVLPYFATANAGNTVEIAYNNL